MVYVFIWSRGEMNLLGDCTCRAGRKRQLDRKTMPFEVDRRDEMDVCERVKLGWFD
jgi:hypothetical protein